MTYYVMGMGGEGFKTHSPHTQKLFFDEKWKKEKGKIGRSCLHFFTLSTLVKLLIWHYLYQTVGGGGRG